MSLSIEKKQSNIKHNLVPRFYILSVVVTAFFFLISSFAVGQEAQAVSCPTDDGNGVGCADAAYPYYCNGACKSAAEAPTCVGGWTPSPLCASGIACTNFAAADACGYGADCNSGYTRCGAWKSYTCIATVSPVSPCASWDSCNSTCTSCISGYGLWNGTCSTLTLKLGYDSVSGNSLIQSLTYPSLFIPVSGYVGIGTSTPNDLLTIGANTTLPANQSTIGTGHNSTQTYNSADSYALANVGYVNTTVNGAVSGSGALLWASSTSGIYNVGLGNVGIGTNNPQVKLDVSGILASGMGVGSGEIRSYQSALILPSDYGTYVSLKTSAGKSGIFRSNTDYFLYYDTSTGSTNIVSTVNSQPIIFKYQANELARITSTGNFGIGTTTPGAKIHVVGDGTSFAGVFQNDQSTTAWASTYAAFNLANANPTANNDALFSFSDNTGFSSTAGMGANFTDRTNHYGDLYFYTKGTDGYNQRLYVQSGGNVGIGTTAPDSLLTVQKNVSGGRGGEISIVNYAPTATGNEAALNFGLESSTYNADNGNAQIKARLSGLNGASTDMIFSLWSGSAFSEYMRILSSGKVGIGTTNPLAKLEVWHANTSNDSTVSNYAFKIYNNAWSANQLTGIEFWNGNQKVVPTSRIISQMNGSGNGGENLFFQTQSSSGTNPNPNQPTTKLLISADGYVGIGTTTPTDLLNIGTYSQGATIQSTVGTGHNSTQSYSSDDSYALANVGYVKTVADAINLSSLWSGTKNGNIYNGTSGAGKVGIGTTNPTSLLQIGSSIASGTLEIQQPTAAGSYDQLKLGIDTWSMANRGLRFQSWNNTGSYEQFLIYNGRISGTGPTYTQGNYNNFQAIKWGSSGMSFLTNPTPGSGSETTITPNTALFIANSGNVGVGTSSPSQLFTVGNNNQFTVSSAGIVTAGLASYQISDQTNIATNISGANVLAYAPFGAYLWHDKLRFNVESGAPVFEIYNGSWNTATLDAEIFAGRNSYNTQIINGTTDTAARWTWNNGGFAYGQAYWWLIGVTYTGTASAKNFLIETSADGITWSPIHSSVGNTTNSAQVALYTPNVPANTYMRLTITVTNSQPLKLSTIQALSNRVGSQFGGAENSFPYTWDASRNVSFPANLTVDTNTLFVDSVNNRVGIGTTAPATGLQVIGSMSVSGQFSQNLNFVTGSWRPLVNGGGMVWTAPTISDSKYYLGFANYGTAGSSVGVSNRMVIDTANGNVGIGTSSPTDLLNIGTYSQGATVQSTVGTGHNSTQSYSSDDSYALANVGYVNGVVGAANFWKLGGNTLSTTTEIGTISAHDFPIITSDVERMRITAAGNVGIGITNPKLKFEARGTAGAPATSGTAQTGVARFGGQAGTYTHVLDIGAYSAAPYGIWLQTANETNLGFTYPLILNPNGGNVGIGTTNPLDKLHVISATSSTSIMWPLIVNNTNNSLSGAYGVGIKLKASDNGEPSKWVGIAAVNESNWAMTMGMAFYTKNDPSYLGTLPSEVMRINAAGNVGIGITNPAQKLVVSAATSSISAAYFQGGNAGTAVMQIDTSNGQSAPSISFLAGSATYPNKIRSVSDFAIETNGANERLRITSAGNVGIGTTTPGAKLEVYTGGGNAISINKADDTTYSNLAFQEAGASKSLLSWIGANAGLGIRNNSFEISTLGSSAITFRTSNSERVRVTETGKVGIGTTTPTDLLNIGTYSQGATIQSGVGTGHNSTQSYSSDDVYALANVGYVNGVVNSANFWKLGGNTFSTTTEIGTISAHDFPIITSDVERMRITAGGNVGVGTTNATRKLSVNGIFGVQYSDTLELLYANPTSSGLDFAVKNATGGTDFRIDSRTGQKVAWYDGGNFGIGTTTPSAKLHVSVPTTGTKLIIDDSYSVNGKWGFAVGIPAVNDTTFRLRHESSNLDVLTALTDGKVGIGTTAPTEKLHIAGSLKLDSGISNVNLITNGSFNMGTGNGWSLYASSGQGAVASYTIDTNTYVSYPNSLKVSVTNGGTGTTAIQLENRFGNYVLTNSRFYTYSFWAKVSSGTYNLTGYVGMAASPYTSYGPISTTLTTTWQKISKTFQFTGTDSDAQEINIFLGGATASGLDIYFDNITISPGAASPEAQPLVIKDDGTVLMESNVGIGTTNPTENLVVQKNVFGGTTAISVVNNSGGGSATAAINLSTYRNSTANPYNTSIQAVDDGNSSSHLRFLTKAPGNNANALSERIRITSSGLIGIGTTTPNDLLTIGANNATSSQSSIGTGHNSVASYNSADSYALANVGYVNAVADGINLSSLWGGSKNGNIWNGTSGAGNVGIGTTNPGAKLDVFGGANISGTINQGTTLWASSGVQTLYKASVYGDERTRSLYVQTFNDGSNNVDIYNMYGGSLHANTTLSNPVFKTILNYSGFAYGKTNNGLFNFYTYVSTGADYNPATPTNIMTFNNAGRVGIGTTNPSGKLTVAGLIQAGVAESNTVDVSSWTALNTNYMLTGPAGYWGLRTATNHSINFDVYNSGSQLAALTILQSGNVGIGTTNPGKILTLNKPTGSANAVGAAISLMRADNPLYGAGIWSGFDSLSREFIKFGAAQNADPFGDAQTIMTLLSSGNVGIGTTTPTQKLDVNGSISTIGAALPSFAATGSIYASGSGVSAIKGVLVGVNIPYVSNAFGGHTIGYSNQANPKWLIGLSRNISNENTLIYAEDSSAATIRLAIAPGGNIGIGTSTPNDLLTIGPNNATSSQSSLGTGHNSVASYNSADSYALANVGYVNAVADGINLGSLWGGVKNGNIYNGVAGAGNVGIGTTTPTQKLDLVGGNFELDNTTFANQNGIIMKNGTRFIHDFNYGWNGTVTTVGYNTFVGVNAGNLTMGSAATTIAQASYNTGVGNSALMGNTTGYLNAAFGKDSLRSNTTGFQNNAVGSSALQTNTIGNNNNAMGVYAMYLNTTGSNNSAQGAQSLYSNTVGDNNTAMGYNALFSSVAGSGGVAIGVQSQFYANSTTTAWTNTNTSVGYQALRGSGAAANNTGNFNTALGYGSMVNNTSGSYNSTVGYNSLMSNTTGNSNTAIGYYALFANTQGANNIGIGHQSLQINTTGSGNIALGYFSLNNISGSNNIALGSSAGRSIADGNVLSSGENSIFLGYDTRAAAVGQTNQVVIGYGAMGNGSNSVTLGNNSITKTILKGYVGISTTTPTDLLNIGTYSQGATIQSALGTGHNSTQSYSSDDIYALTNVGYINSVVSGINLSISGTIATYSTSTDITYNGSRSGYTSANALCAARSTGSHVCTTGEILNTINKGLGSTLPTNSQLWISNGPPAFTANANDCQGWTTSSNNSYGAIWNKLASGDGFGSLKTCEKLYKFACCK